MAFFAGVVQVLFTTEAQRAQRFLAGDLIGRRYGFRGGCGWRFLRGWYRFFLATEAQMAQRGEPASGVDTRCRSPVQGSIRKGRRVVIRAAW